MPDTSRSWLVVIDLQPAFSHPESPWFAPALADSVRQIETLVPLYGERVVFTRFVPPEDVEGSWQAYYGKWAFATEREADWLWPVDGPFGHHKSIASHTFSKWIPEMRTLLGPYPDVVLCGVSTDCCVLATALAAVDDGAHVRVISDACAAKSPEVHRMALDLLSMRAPQLSIATAAEEHRRMSALA